MANVLTLFADDGMGLGGIVINEGTVGSIARLRLYGAPLTQDQIAALAVPEPSTWMVLALGATLVGTVALRRSRAA